MDTTDPRDKPRLTRQDIVALNFIKEAGPFVFRRHHRAGLRSHIMEVLNRPEVEKETEGVIMDGVKWFPRARPLKMLRIFRRKFESLEAAEGELKRVRIIETFLAPDYMARSSEFLVDFVGKGRREPMLCGLQEYVAGEAIDPWGTLDESHLLMLFRRMRAQERESSAPPVESWLRNVRERAQALIGHIKEMIAKAHHVPDLAGLGNLILTWSGHIRLVDINNISEVSFDPAIPLDDRGYPVCDKSIEALSLLESKILDRSIDRGEELYAVFLDPERLERVKVIEDTFHHAIKPLPSSLDSPM